MPYWGLLKRKEALVLSWPGRILLLLVGVAALLIAARNAYPFLAPSRPAYGEVLIVEGWMPDAELEQAIRVFDTHDYELLVTTGGPLLIGSFLSEYSTYAQLTAASLRRLGVEQNVIVPVPAPPVQRDRTYASALAVKDWLSKTNSPVTSVDVFSLGAHARRTQLLFQKALGDNVSVGVIAATDPEYDPNKWWVYSSGVRSVIGETLAYLYARFLFKPQESAIAYGH